MKVCILPDPSQFKSDTGGVNRVVQSLIKEIPKYGWEVVTDAYSADVVHSHALAFHPRIGVYTNHGIIPDPISIWRQEANRIIRDCIVSAKIVTSVSQWTTNIYREALKVSPEIIRNGINLEELESVKPGRGFSITKTKNPYFLWAKNSAVGVNNPARALDLAKRMPDWPFVFTHLPTTERPPNVIVTGNLSYDDMKSVIRDCYCLMGTTKENFSVQILEALAMGKPVLGVNWGGTAEVIEDGLNGMLSDPAYNMLSAARELIRGYSLLSDGARETAKRFDWSIIVPKYIDCYERVLSSRSATPVSIIITCYNMENYITDAVESAMRQDFKLPYEVIVVDDKSTDRSRGVLESLKIKYPEITLQFNAENMKVGPSRNAGIERSIGEYIVCLDGDDKITPDFVSTLYDAIKDDPDVGIAYSNFELFGANRGVVVSSPWSFEKLKRNNIIPCCNMFRRIAWERVRGYKNINPSWEDYELWISIGEIGFKGVRISRPLLKYRVKSGEGRNYESRYHSERLQAIVRAYHPRLYSSKVGIIIPCYEQGKWLPDAINSLLNGDYQEFRAIIVNDGSSQNLSSMMPHDPRFSLINLEHNVGLPAARNAGIKELKTEFILPLDADDMLISNSISTLLKIQDKTAKPIIVYGDLFVYHREDAQELLKLEEYNFDSLLNKSIMPATSMYPRESWEKVGGYDESMRSGYEDWDFHIRLGLNGVCGVHVPIPTFKYRQHEDSMRKVIQDQSNSDLRQSVVKYIHDKNIIAYEGDRPMGCCGGKKRTIVDVVLPDIDPGQDEVLLSYTGQKIGTMTMSVGGRRYSFSANSRRFIANTSHLARLMGTGWFEVVT